MAALFPLRLLVTTLPDPYATNVNLPASKSFGGTRSNAAVVNSQNLLSLTSWDAGGPVLSFHYDPGQTANAAALTASVLAKSAAATAPASFAAVARESDAQLTAEVTFGAALPGPTGNAPGVVALLDVSSAADQFGVRFGPSRSDSQIAEIAASADPADTVFAIDGMTLQATARRIRVITLPAVQWEPMTFTPDAAFGDPRQSIGFADSGGETQLGSLGTRLVAVAPNPALDQLLADYNAATHVGAVALLTFPYGIRAFAPGSSNRLRLSFSSATARSWTSTGPDSPRRGLRVAGRRARRGG